MESILKAQYNACRDGTLTNQLNHFSHCHWPSDACGPGCQLSQSKSWTNSINRAVFICKLPLTFQMVGLTHFTKMVFWCFVFILVVGVSLIL